MNIFVHPTIAIALITSLSVTASQSEEMVVTGTMSSESVNNLSSSVTILNREDIEVSNKSNVADLLKSVPGLFVEEQGGAGGLTSVSLRGGEFNFTVVMVDGVQVNDPTNTRGGSYDFGNLNINSVERIEIVRGAQSALYGSDALSGVINIITTRPRPGHQAYVKLEGGEFGYQRGSIAFAGELDTLGYKFQLGHRDSGEPVKNSNQRSNDLNIALHWQASDKHQLNLNYLYSDGERRSYPEESGGPLFAVSDELTHSDYADESLATGWDYQVGEYWLSQVSASYYQRTEDYTSPGIVPYTNIPPNAADTQFERTSMRWVNRVGNDRYWLNAGADYRDEDGHSVGSVDFGVLIPTEFELQRSTQGVFIDLNGWVTESTLLQASARHDDPDDTDSETSYKLGLKQQLGNQFSFRANWGQGFKLPSFFALGDPLTGNPGLQPETATSWDATLEWSTSELGSSLTYFDNHFENLVTFDNLSFSNVNSDPVDTRGVEWEAHWRPTNLPLSLQANATYTDIDPENPELKLTGRTEWVGGISANWNINTAWAVHADYRYTGEQYAGSQHTGSGTMVQLDNYQLVDLGVSWSMTPSLTVKGMLDNALDEEYENAVGFPGVGRMLRVGIEWDLF